MKTLRQSIVSRVGLGLIVTAFSACAANGNPLTNPTEFDSMVPGWQSRFSIDWHVAPGPDGTNRLSGRIVSHYGQHAEPFRVLGMALDASGKVVGQRIEWVPGGVPGYSQTYFEIDRLAVAASYRVTVWDYYFIQGGKMISQRIE